MKGIVSFRLGGLRDPLHWLSFEAACRQFLIWRAQAYKRRLCAMYEGRAIYPACENE